MWNSFMRKNKLEEIDFAEVVKTITEQLQPIYNSIMKSDVANT